MTDETLYTADRLIGVVNRGDDWMAYFVGDRRLWDCSKVSPEAAVAKLRLSAADVLDTSERWPIDVQVQHDTNVAAQDVEMAASRLRKLLTRMQAEGISSERIDHVAGAVGTVEGLISNLYKAK